MVRAERIRKETLWSFDANTFYVIDAIRNYLNN